MEAAIPVRTKSKAGGSDLVKVRIASELRERILKGELQPGDLISETQWAPRLGAAQASVREAINLLVTEGLVRKEPGCSARVTKLTSEAVAQAYQVRQVLEGLAARLLAEQDADLSSLEEAIEAMNQAARKQDLRRTVEADLAFHLRLCELPGNTFLASQARQILVPVFAFTMIRVLAEKTTSDAWIESIEDHSLILAGIRSGDPHFAEQSARHTIGKFVTHAARTWASTTQGK